MKSIRMLLACSLAIAALAGTTAPAVAQTEEDTAETQHWCEVVPRFCCNSGPSARCRPT